MVPASVGELHGTLLLLLLLLKHSRLPCSNPPPCPHCPPPLPPFQTLVQALNQRSKRQPRAVEKVCMCMCMCMHVCMCVWQCTCIASLCVCVCAPTSPVSTLPCTQARDRPTKPKPRWPRRRLVLLKVKRRHRQCKESEVMRRQGARCPVTHPCSPPLPPHCPRATQTRRPTPKPLLAPAHPVLRRRRRAANVK